MVFKIRLWMALNSGVRGCHLKNIFIAKSLKAGRHSSIVDEDGYGND